MSFNFWAAKFLAKGTIYVFSPLSICADVP